MSLFSQIWIAVFVIVNSAVLAMSISFGGELGGRMLRGRKHGFRHETFEQRLALTVVVLRSTTLAANASAVGAIVGLLQVRISGQFQDLIAPYLSVGFMVSTGIAGAAVAIAVHALAVAQRTIRSKTSQVVKEPRIGKSSGNPQAECICGSGLKARHCERTPVRSPARQRHNHLMYARGLTGPEPILQWITTTWSGFGGGFIAPFVYVAFLTEPLAMLFFSGYVLLLFIALGVWASRGKR